MEQAIEIKVKERPILFSTPMVQAILEGRKTVTRRVVTDMLELLSLLVDDSEPLNLVYSEWIDYEDDEVMKPEWLAYSGDNTEECTPLGQGYGQVGDMLWVRETFSKIHYEGVDEKPTYIYKADNNNPVKGIWKPSIFMPREACRIKLQIVSVSVERLHDITDEDAVLEGVVKDCDYGTTGYRNYLKPEETVSDISARESFETLWTSINGRESWESNPWVWRIEFKKL
jgi:hypothetical protein